MAGSMPLDDLRVDGRIHWDALEHGWVAEPNEVFAALARAGFDEYKREIACSRRGCDATGGIWQGLDSRTGSVASAVWVKPAEIDAVVVFVDIDGEPLTG